MTFILSTLLSTLILTSCMIFIFDFCIHKQWNMTHILFKLFLLTIFIKLCFPFETKLSILIPLDKIMNPLIAILQYKLFNQIYIYHFLLSIAVIGSIYQFAELIKHIRECNYIIHEVKNNGIRIENPDYEIYQTSYINTPIVMGLRGIILIPEDLNKEEIDYALKHEITHIKHKDNLIKFTANLFKILFWWFIPIYIFNKQLDLYLELNADNKAIENLEEHKKLDYLNFLVKTQKQAIKSSTTVLNSNLSFNRKSNLNYRINAILNKKTRSAIFIVPILFIMIFLNFLIFTPYYTDSDLTKGTYEISKSNAYILVNGGEKQLVVNMDGESFISPIKNYSLLKKETDLREKNSLYIPDHALDNVKNMTRWKYKDVDGHLSKRKFNAYKNSWESDWISYSKQNKQ